MIYFSPIFTLINWIFVDDLVYQVNMQFPFGKLDFQ